MKKYINIYIDSEGRETPGRKTYATHEEAIKNKRYTSPEFQRHEVREVVKLNLPL